MEREALEWAFQRLHHALAEVDGIDQRQGHEQGQGQGQYEAYSLYADDIDDNNDKTYDIEEGYSFDGSAFDGGATCGSALGDEGAQGQNHLAKPAAAQASDPADAATERAGKEDLLADAHAKLDIDKKCLTEGKGFAHRLTKGLAKGKVLKMP